MLTVRCRLDPLIAEMGRHRLELLVVTRHEQESLLVTFLQSYW